MNRCLRAFKVPALFCTLPGAETCQQTQWPFVRDSSGDWVLQSSDKKKQGCQQLALDGVMISLWVHSWRVFLFCGNSDVSIPAFVYIDALQIAFSFLLGAERT